MSDLLKRDDREVCVHEPRIRILRLAKLKSRRHEGWGFIKSLSANSMSLEVHLEFDLGETVQVILADDKLFTGIVGWRQGEFTEIHLHEKIDVALAVKMVPTAASAKTRRLPRVEMQLPIKIRLGYLALDAEICDISPSGLCFRSEQQLEIGKLVTLLVPGLAEVIGIVRWRLNDCIGIVFSERLPLRKIMQWLSIYYTVHQATNAAQLTLGSMTMAPVPVSTAYYLFGHDELDRKIPIAILSSASLAMANLKATERFFVRVSVTTEYGVELSMTTLHSLTMDEQPKLQS